MRGIRARLGYANVMATVAVVIALTGSAYVAFALERGEVRSFHIKDRGIKTEDLARNATIGNARKVGGSIVRHISHTAPADLNSPPATYNRLFRLNGLTISAHCSNTQDRVFLKAETSVDGSIIGVGAVHGKTYGGGDDTAFMEPGVVNVFDSGDPKFAEIDDTATVLVYGNGADSKPVVTATFLANQFAAGDSECKVVGTVVAS